MMKLAICFVLFVSCGKYVERKEFQKKTNEYYSVKNTNQYTSNIDVMMAFLWPEKISVSNEAYVEDVISLSNKIFKSKSKYVKNKIQYNNSYRLYGCECLDFFECEDEILIKCETIQENIDDNNLMALDLLADHQEIENLVLKMGGELFKITPINLGVMDYYNNQLVVESFSDERVEMNVENQTLSFYHDKKSFWAKLDIKQSPESIIYQGELRSGKRKGIIYWELFHRDFYE